MQKVNGSKSPRYVLKMAAFACFHLYEFAIQCVAFYISCVRIDREVVSSVIVGYSLLFKLHSIFNSDISPLDGIDTFLKAFLIVCASNSPCLAI